ncbi:MAG: hypothetical protein IPK19_12665 [Chloroflexi bacterium]|nr:hypothetical protein [Chloroflexota bacterium]
MLNSDNPAKREEGIRRAAATGNAAYIKALWAIHDADQEQALRDKAQQAVTQIRRAQKAASGADPARASTTNPAVKTGKSGPAPRARQTATESAKKGSVAFLPVLLVSIVFLSLVVVIAWLLLNSLATPLQQAADTIGFISRLANPKQFPIESAAPEELTGNFWVGMTVPFSNFYVLEPTGKAPPDGWPLLVLIHDWMSEGLAMMQPYATRAAEEGVLLVAAAWDHRSTMMLYEGYQFYGDDVFEMLSAVWAYYPIDDRSVTVSGFGWGASLAAFIGAHSQAVFPGIVLGAADYYPLQTLDSLSRYAVVVGENDALDGINYPQVALEFLTAMRDRGTPVWFAEVVTGAEHEMTSTQIDAAFDLLASLRASPS